MSERNFYHACGLVFLGLLLALPVMADSDDPMRPPQARQATTPAAQQSWDLSSVLIGERRRLAVINDQMVKVGDRVGGARVQRIEADRVILLRGEQSMTLTLRADLDIRRSEGD